MLHFSPHTRRELQQTADDLIDVGTRLAVPIQEDDFESFLDHFIGRQVP